MGHHWKYLCLTLLISEMATSSRMKRYLIGHKFNHQPYFQDCPRKFSVREDVGEKVPIGQVHADDEDDGFRGKLIHMVYEVKPEMPFKTIPETGTIITKELFPFDYDDPSNQKKFYMTIIAVDDGAPRRYAQCDVEVSVVDVNDNSPIFNKEVYSEKMLKNSNVGDKVMKVSATDIDSGKNSLVKYSITSDDENDERYFRIDEISGDIYLNAKINKDPGYIFRFHAKAQDMGKPPLSSETALEIQVVQSTNKPPSFNTQSPFTLGIAENDNDFETTRMSFSVASNIDKKPHLEFELVSGTTEQTNKEETFKLKVSENVANITLSKHLDYERINRYSLILRATNEDNLSTEMEIIVNVDDVNDNAPYFQNNGPFYIEGEKVAGYRIAKVHARDDDGTTENNQVTYQLVTHTDMFVINRETGVITVLDRIYNENQRYKLKVIATDNSPSALRTDSLPNKSEYDFSLNVMDDWSNLVDPKA